MIDSNAKLRSIQMPFCIQRHTMKNIAAIKRNNRKIHARKFLSTPEGKAWLERKQRENEERKLLSELKWLREDF
ncbi:hypothetical protein DL775_25530 [Shigella sonnei]|nr:hypothetical protein [Shigella sonnei]